MEKSRDAFRTISEVAEWLDVPTHVLRFWESRFSQIKPVKRAGGRRYYRPSDMRVIGGVKTLLHDQGMTIRGVQKLFREKGIKHISGHSPILYGEEEPVAQAEGETIDQKVAEPAAAARFTHTAELDPIVDATSDLETAASEDTAETKGTVDAKTIVVDSESAEAPAAEPVLQFKRSTPEPSENPKPVSFDVPDHVPATDPLDDDAEHDATAGIAARLRTLPPGALVAHKDILATAVDKLKALRAPAD